MQMVGLARIKSIIEWTIKHSRVIWYSWRGYKKTRIYKQVWFFLKANKRKQTVRLSTNLESRAFQTETSKISLVTEECCWNWHQPTASLSCYMATLLYTADWCRCLMLKNNFLTVGFSIWSINGSFLFDALLFTERAIWLPKITVFG